MAGLPEPFSVDVRPERDCVLIVPRGELDLATVQPVRAAVAEATELGWREIQVDLRQLSFLDCSGIELLLSVKNDAATAGIAFSIIEGNAIISRTLEIAGVNELLECSPPRDV